MENIGIKGIVETITIHLWEFVQKRNCSVKDRGSLEIVAETAGCHNLNIQLYIFLNIQLYIIPSLP